MKRTITDLLFDQKFKDGVSRDSITNYHDQKKEDPASAMASLIAYVLKFKRKELSHSVNSSDYFSEIKQESLYLFRKNNHRVISGNRFFRIAIAASVLLIFSIGGYWFGENRLFSGRAFQPEVVEFNTPEGQQSELTLPDGTFVALNYGSKLKYRIASGTKLQEVELDGEAFFKVTKNKARTFRVITDKMNVNVLGTEFNVRAYKSDLKIETTLLEGSIEIKNISDQNRTVLLKPGEKWSYDKTEKQQSIAGVDPQLSTLWRNGEYYFEKISLGELAKTLERMYRVNIHFQDSSLENEVYSGSVYQKEEIGNLFQVIDLTLPIIVKAEGKEIWITRK